MPNHLPKYSLLVISLSTPLLIGVYKDNILIEKKESNLKTSDILLPLIEELFKKYNFKEMIYTNSPGSYMSNKLTYITLKTIETIKDISLFGCSGFTLNNNQPIKAMGNLYFIKEKETIITKKLTQPIKVEFTLPNNIKELKLEKPNLEYFLPAVF